jgi:DNA polymerase V
MNKQLIALIDCSSFYCSCERAFRADLDGKAIVVLSNNDGCVISLTPNAKELGIKMGTPYYQIKKELDQKGITVFSSNYCLYADMSKRVINIIRRFADDVEQYSIDEAFARFTVDTDHIEEARAKMQQIAEDIHYAVLKGTGIPVRVSLGENKTLAKVGSEYTKKLLKEGKVPAICFWELPERDEYMKTLKVSDVWGIGREWSKKLEASGIATAYDLSQASPTVIRASYNVVMERTVRELQGSICIPLELETVERKSMVRSRMFATKLSEPTHIRQAVSAHLTRGAEKLRREHLLAGQLSVYITTGRHAIKRRSGYMTAQLTRPTNDTFTLNKLAMELFDRCYISGYQYSKAGITFTSLMNESAQSESLLSFEEHEKPELMMLLDKVNARFGKYAIVPASMGVPDKLRGVEAGSKNASEWGMRREKMSPRYTTEWNNLLKVAI